MGGETHNRVTWRNLVCIVVATLVMTGQLFASPCSTSGCSSRNSKTETRRSGMDMASDRAAVHANRSLSCCRMTRIPPGTIERNGHANKVSPTVSILPVPHSVPGGAVTLVRIPTRQVHGPPPHDVQSLFCTLLV